MLPLGIAYLDAEPLLAISAQIPDDFPPSHTHQLLPLHDVYRPIARVVETVNARNVSDIVPRALTACMTRPFGTAYLTLSAREALKPYDGSADHTRDDRAPTTADRPMRSRDAMPSDVAQRAADALTARLASAKRPLVLVGLGIDPSHADRLRRWLTAWNLPVAVTPKVKGIVDETAPTFVGIVGGMAADGLLCDALAAADLLIGFGLDPVEIDKTWHAELPIEWVLETPNVGGLVPSGAALVDHASLLDVLAAARPPASWTAPFREFQDKRRAMLDRPESRQSSRETMWPGDVVRALADVLPPETIVTTDVGSHKYLFGQFWPSRRPETFWMSNGLSGMAYGLSAAIGAKLARPGAPVLAAVGDGGFSMNAQELETAERVGAPFITVVLEDCSYSLIKLSQEGKRLDSYRTDFTPIDTVKMAEACGVESVRTTDPNQLASAARTAVERGRSLVIAIPIDYADYRRLF
jgi:acetolactate synthase-1/2/3 large subunit